jgi:hypothetical protein
MGLSTAPNSMGMVAVNHSMTSAPQLVPYASPTAYVYQSRH